MQRIPILFRFIIAITLLTLVILFGMRLIFWFMFNNPADPVPFDNILYAFYLGTKFDLRLTLFALIPLFALGWIKPLSPFRNTVAHYAWLVYLVLVASCVLIFYLADFGHYAYLHKRIDATMLRFLDNFDTSLQMVWQSYAVVPWIMLIISLIIVDAYVVKRLLRYYAAQPIPEHKKRHKAWIAPLGFFLFVFGMYGKFSWYPLRWSDAFFSTHAYAASVASNPVLYFFNTLKNQNITYDENRTREYYDLISQYLGVQQPDKSALNFTRHIPARQKHDRPPNVVMVFLESFASYKTGAFGNPLDPTPYFDKLNEQGVSFSNYFTPHVGTARSVWAAITGLPDIEVNKTSTRNPLVVDQHTIINAFRDYEKYYFIGGSANWGNIRGILSNNIHGLKLYEEGNYTNPRMDVWGLSDLHLFEEANRVLTKEEKPFFAIIQTAGNHRPYHIPEDNRNFKRRDVDNATLAKSGFISLDEFNAFRFMDHSIAFYIEQAKKEKYFNNTIFVFFGDHGITGYVGNHGRQYLTHTELSGLATPLLFYAPELLKPAKYNKVASELDLLPTIAGLAGVDYVNTALGRDLFDPQFDDSRYAFTIKHSRKSEIGLLDREFYLQIMEDGSNPRLYAIHSDDFRENVIDKHPEQAQQLREMAFGLYETTKFLMHHNKNNQAE